MISILDNKSRLPSLLYSLGKIIEYRFSPGLTTFVTNVIANWQTTAMIKQEWHKLHKVYYMLEI
jgi:hypothetical protein